LIFFFLPTLLIDFLDSLEISNPKKNFSFFLKKKNFSPPPPPPPA